MNGADTQIWTALIATVGGIITTYITMRYSAEKKKRDSGNPLNPTDSIFNGYEKLIKQQQLDIERKTTLIEHLQQLVDQQRLEIQKSQDLINTLREELEENKHQTVLLAEQLDNMKRDYKSTK